MVMPCPAAARRVSAEPKRSAPERCDGSEVRFASVPLGRGSALLHDRAATRPHCNTTARVHPVPAAAHGCTLANNQLEFTMAIKAQNNRAKLHRLRDNVHRAQR